MSVQTQSATIPAGRRRLLSADSDGAGGKQEVQYVTRGNHLLAMRPGISLGDELTEARISCIIVFMYFLVTAPKGLANITLALLATSRISSNGP